MVASIVETSAVVDTYKKHWQECRPCPVSAAEAVWQWHKSLNGAEKKIHNAAAFCSTTTPHEQNQTFMLSMFTISDITTATSAPHLRYGFTSRKKKSTMPPHSVLLLHRMNRIRHSYLLCSQFLTSSLPLLHHTACIESQA